MGVKFQRVLWRSLQSFLLALVLFLSICISYACIIGCCIAWWCINSLYKLSWKWLSSITKMGEIERTCGAPMFGFGNWWQSLWTNGCHELYLKVLSIGFSWSTCVGFKESLCRPRCYSRNYPKIGHVRVELIASMSWRRRLCDHSCLPSRHHPNEESWKESRLIKTKYRE